MIGFLKRYLQKGIIKKCIKMEQRAFLSFKDVSSVGFVYYMESEENLDDLKSALGILNRTDIPYTGLIIEGQKELFSKMNFNLENLKNKLILLNHKDISWLGLPSGQDLESFLELNFDMLICCGQTSNFSLEYISRVVNWGFKVGNDSSIKDLFSFVVQAPYDNKVSAEEFLKELFKYLKIIKNNES